MPTVFTRIIEGELPAYFVWEDEWCVAFLAKPPFRPGHTLLVPREEVDQWQELDPRLLSHLTSVAQRIGKALRTGFRAARVGVFIAGVEIPHAHIHLIPVELEVYRMGFDFMAEEEFRQRVPTTRGRRRHQRRPKPGGVRGSSRSHPRGA